MTSTMTDRFLALMYHNVVRDGELAGPRCAGLGASITSYFVEESRFCDQLRLLAEIARPIDLTCVADMISPRTSSGQSAPLPSDDTGMPPRPSVLLTFDDGWRGCFEIATDHLRQTGFQGLMFVTTSYVGRDMFCRWSDLQERDRDVWRIGSHLVHHRFLNEDSPRVIRRELLDSKRVLEDQLGEPIDSVSIPNGATSRLVRQLAREAGYQFVFCSAVGWNRRGAPTDHLARVAVRSWTTTAQIQRWLQGQLGSARWKQFLLQKVKTLLGHRRYRLWRSRWLSDPDARAPIFDAEQLFDKEAEETLLAPRHSPPAASLQTGRPSGH